MLQNNTHHWSQRVTETSQALDLEPGVFSWDDPRRIALSMLNFYINRAGKHLSVQQWNVLEKAKEELWGLYGKSHIKS